MNNDNRIKDNWLKEFERVRGNAIYFLETYWNKLHPDEAVALTDEEKQRAYDKYKFVPLLDSSADLRAYEKMRKEARENGVKDWEAFL